MTVLSQSSESVGTVQYGSVSDQPWVYRFCETDDGIRVIVQRPAGPSRHRPPRTLIDRTVDRSTVDPLLDGSVSSSDLQSLPE